MVVSCDVLTVISYVLISLHNVFLETLKTPALESASTMPPGAKWCAIPQTADVHFSGRVLPCCIVQVMYHDGACPSLYSELHGRKRQAEKLQGEKEGLGLFSSKPRKLCAFQSFKVITFSLAIYVTVCMCGFRQLAES